MRRERQSVDNLYEPTLAGAVERPAGLDPPWRLGSQGYVAFFGGPLAAGVVGFLNARRLDLEDGRALAILGIGVLGLSALLLLAALFDGIADLGRGLLAVSGLACYVATRQLQKRADRRYALLPGANEAYRSLWGPGLMIVLGCGLVSYVLVGVVT